MNFSLIFFSTWLTAILSYNPTWVFSVMPHNNIPNNDVDEIKMRELLGAQSSFYNVFDAQKLDLCGQFQEPKLILTSSENIHLLKGLIFVTSYFIRCSVVRRKALVKLNRSQCSKIRKKVQFWEIVALFASKAQRA